MILKLKILTVSIAAKRNLISKNAEWYFIFVPSKNISQLRLFLNLEMKKTALFLLNHDASALQAGNRFFATPLNGMVFPALQAPFHLRR